MEFLFFWGGVFLTHNIFSGTRACVSVADGSVMDGGTVVLLLSRRRGHPHPTALLARMM